MKKQRKLPTKDDTKFQELSNEEVLSGMSKEGNFWRVFTKKLAESVIDSESIKNKIQENQDSRKTLLKSIYDKTTIGKIHNKTKDLFQGLQTKKEESISSLKNKAVGVGAKVLNKTGLISQTDFEELNKKIDVLNNPKEKKKEVKEEKIIERVDKNSIQSKKERKENNTGINDKINSVIKKTNDVYNLVYNFTHKQDTSIQKKPKKKTIISNTVSKDTNRKEEKSSSSFLGDLVNGYLISKFMPKSIKNKTISIKDKVSNVKDKAKIKINDKIQKSKAPKILKNIADKKLKPEVKTKLEVPKKVPKVKVPKVKTKLEVPKKVPKVKVPKVKTKLEVPKKVPKVKVPKTKLPKSLGNISKETKETSKIIKSLSKVKGIKNLAKIGGKITKKLPLIGTAISVGLGVIDYATADSDKGRKEAVGGAAGGAAGAAAGAEAGAIIGQLLIPIPVVGALIGSAVGGIAGGMFGDSLGRKVSHFFSDVDDTIDDKNKKNPFTFKTALLLKKAQLIQAEKTASPDDLKEIKKAEKEIDKRVIEVTDDSALEDYLDDSIDKVQKTNKNLTKDQIAKKIILNSPPEYQDKMVDIYNKKIVGGWFHSNGNLKITDKDRKKSNKRSTNKIKSKKIGVPSFKNKTSNKKSSHNNQNSIVNSLNPSSNTNNTNKINSKKNIPTISQDKKSNNSFEDNYRIKQERLDNVLQIGTGDLSDFIWGAGKNKDIDIDYEYYKDQKYKWQYKDLIKMGEDYKKGKSISTGMAYIPHDKAHLNPFSSNNQAKFNTKSTKKTNTKLTNKSKPEIKDSAPISPSITKKDTSSAPININNNTKKLIESSSDNVKIIEKTKEPIIINSPSQQKPEHTSNENNVTLNNFNSEDLFISSEIIGGH